MKLLASIRRIFRRRDKSRQEKSSCYRDGRHWSQHWAQVIIDRRKEKPEDMDEGQYLAYMLRRVRQDTRYLP